MSAERPAVPPRPVSRRSARALEIRYPAELPISARTDDILDALERHAVVIVAGATGSGKTTQLPKLALQAYERRQATQSRVDSPSPDAARELRAPEQDGSSRAAADAHAGAPPRKRRRRRRRRQGDATSAEGDAASLPLVSRSLRQARVGITQPRRIAATSVAARVASELGCALGNEVGYQIRFEDQSGPDTQLKFMTDGVLLAELQGNPELRGYHTLIIDEAHERSLTIDLLLGTLKQLLPRRPDLKVIISSATIETQRFSEFFDGAPVVEVEGRTFPVDVLYEPPHPELELCEAVADAVESVLSLDPQGDFLVFLPGEREISDTERTLRGRRLRGAEILPLFGRLSAAEQSRVFAPGGARRVILATNVAETSLTIPGIVYVVDSGLARLSRYDPRTGTTRLQIEPISRASADQRKGRSGRVREGICVRLYAEQDFEARPAFTDPEVRRVGLAGVILRMKSAQLGEIETFPFLDPPEQRAIAEGYRVLEELGAIDAERELTVMGRRLSRFPVDPRIARMIIAGSDAGCLDEVLVVAAALEIRDPRERPRDAEQKADQLHRRFRDESSDFASLLALWRFVDQARSKGSAHLRRVCRENYLSHARIREWREVHRQLSSTVRELNLGKRRAAGRGALTATERCSTSTAGPRQDLGAALHQALLSGLLSRIGMYEPERRVYVGARQTRFSLHPSSSLAKKPPAWVMAFELVETTRLFARMVARVDPSWFSQVGAHLLQRRYSDPHWSEKSARASVREHATLYGLPVVKDRSVDYATIAPGRARLMFLEHALVRGEYQSRGRFQAKNRALLAEVSRLRDKARQSEMIADDDALLTFFDQRVPSSVVNGKSFETWRREAEQRDPHLLELSLADVLSQTDDLKPEDYPDELELLGVRLPLRYRFDPMAEDDGVTLTLPLPLVPRVSADELDWTIPAWHERRLLELLQRLPKAQRRQLSDLGGPGAAALPQLGSALAARLKPFEGPFGASLIRAISEMTGVSVPADAVRTDLLPGYLRLTLRVCDEQDRVLGQGRELKALLEELGVTARRAIEQQRPPAQERARSTSWDFGELPRKATRTLLGVEVEVYPSLVDRGQFVELTFVDTATEATSSSIRGVYRLITLAQSRQLASIARSLPRPFTRRAGLPASRVETASFHDILLRRILEQAYPIPDADALPRDRGTFEAFLAKGAPRLPSAAAEVTRAIESAAAELDATWRALDDAARQPAGARAIADVRRQLEQLYDADVIAEAPLAQFTHFPRYLRAARVRLERAINNPPKDAQKLAPLAPVWEAYLAKRKSVADQLTARSLRWDFEELRVSIFAPELRCAHPVSLEALARQVAELK